MSALNEFLQHVANGLVLGFLYALVGIGLSMVYGILRMINFAHGEILMVGVYLALPVSALGAPAWLVLLAGVAGATLMGLLIQGAIYRPLLKSPQPKRPAPAPLLDEPFRVGEIVLRNVDISIIVLAIGSMLATHLFLQRT